MSVGGATWTTAGVLDNGTGNTFNPADATESTYLNDQAWWKVTPTVPIRIGIAPQTDYILLRVYRGASEATKVRVYEWDNVWLGGTVYRSDFELDAGVEYHILAGRFDSSVLTYQLTRSQQLIMYTDWDDSLLDDPNNFLIVTHGTRRLENYNAGYAGEPYGGRPTWMNAVLNTGQAREGSYTAFETLGGPDPIAAAGCVIAHADNGESPGIVGEYWDGTCEPLDPGSPTGGHNGTMSTYRSMGYTAPPGFPLPGSIGANLIGPAWGYWFLPVRDHLGPYGVLYAFSTDPTDYGAPADAVIEWEGPRPGLKGIYFADGDPVNTGTAPYTNFWAANFSLFGYWDTGWSTVWNTGPFPTPADVPSPVDTSHPEMAWSYNSGQTADADPWQPVPNSVGWEGHGWTTDVPSGIDGGAGADVSDGMIAAWPDTSGLAPGVTEGRPARPAIKFDLQAQRFRFKYVIPETVTGWAQGSVRSGQAGWSVGLVTT